MFDEKYGQEARVISVGEQPFSRELCGGTHCRATGEIGAFVITDQRSVGAGVRRVDALTGDAAFAWLDERARLVERLSREYNAPPEQLAERLRALSASGGQAAQTPRRPAVALPDPAAVLERAEQRNGTYLVIDWLDGADATTLRDFGDELRRRATSAAIVLGSDAEGKANVAVMLTDDLVQRGLHAGKLAKQIGAAMGAGGGGRPDVATAGGDAAHRDAGLAKARELLREAGA
jgi:alanyl-tRNA synthetase